MKRILLLLFLVSSCLSGLSMVQAQSCDEALAYYVASSPDGQGEQWVAQTLCSEEDEVMQLTVALREESVGEFVWSAVHQAVAYGFGTIYVMNAPDWTPGVALEETETSFYHNPVWSPDGTWLAAIEADEDSAAEWLVVTDLESDTRQIAPIVSNAEEEARIGAIRWSPDGEWIGYAISRFNNAGNAGTTIVLLSTACIDDPEEICEAHPLAITDGSGEPFAAPNEDTLLFEHWWGMTWSPDGEALAFLCGSEAMCFLNVDGTDFRRADITLNGFTLAWSVSGDYLAYQADGDIYLYDIELGTHSNLTQSPEVMEFVPMWIPLPEGEFLFEAE